MTVKDTKSAMDTDYLTCGQCLKEFPLQQITLFIQHKKHDCNEDSGAQFGEADLKCYYCPRGFMTAWGLLVHVQLTHSLRIFVEKSSLSITTQQHDLTHGPSLHISPPEANISTQDNSGERKLLRSTARHDDLDKELEYPIQHGESMHDDIQTSVLNKNRPRHQPFIIDYAEEMQDGDSFPEHSESQNLSKQTVSLDLYKSGHNVDKVEIPHAINTASVIESRQTVYTTNHLTQTSALQIDSVTNKTHLLVKETLLQQDELIHENCHSHAECENEAVPELDDVKQTEKDVRKQIENDARKQIEKEARKEIEKDTRKSNEKDTNSLAECKLVHDTVSSADQEEESTVDGEGSISDCDVQGCGVTVIPGSHEDLQECCNAVVPKKRKRHMMLKHMPFSWSSSRYARLRMLQRSLSMAAKTSTVTQSEPAATGTNTIFIDVEPDALAALTEVDKSQNSDNPTNTSSNSLTENSVAEIKDVDSVPVTMLPPSSESRTKSLILQPGAIFSIPFSYSLPSSISGTPKSIPISIVQQGQSSGKLSGVNSVTKRTLIGLPIGAHNIGQVQGQIQDSRSQSDEMDESDSHGELVIADSDVRRRKYPTSKPFKCDQCPMAFNQRIHLKKHMSKHTGIKPYKCGECDYSTVERSHLKVHIRIHTGEKPFKCTYCEYATAQNSTLKIHLKRHHGGKMFGCHDCDKTFTQIEQLEVHQTEHISGNVEKSVVKKKLPGMDISPGSESMDRKSPSKDSCTGASVHPSGKDASPSTTTSSSSEVNPLPHSDAF